MASILNKFDSTQLSGEEIKRLRLPTTRKQQFWDIVKSQFTNLVKISLLTILLVLPFVLTIGVLQPLMVSVIGAGYDFLGNSLVGYPGSVDSLTVAQIEVQQTNMMFFIILIIPITLMGPALAGLFYTVRNLVWGQNITVRVDYWRGVKLGWKQYTLACFLLGLILALNMSVMTVFNIQSILGQVDVMGVIALTFVIISFIITVGLALYAFPMMAMFNMKFTKVIRNAGLLSAGAFPFTIAMMLLTAVPFLLESLLGDMLGSLVNMFMVMCGYVILGLLYTTMVQYVLDRFIYPRTKSAAQNRGIYKASETVSEEGNAEGEKEAPKVKQRYVNPKKKKKAEPTITPLSQNYSRKDLERLQAEKQKAIAEMDDDGE